MTTVAIDGPSGSGKSTLARAVAAALGLAYLDTGAMYRAVTLQALRRGVALDDEDALGALARTMGLEVGGQVVLDGEDVSAAIRTPEVTTAVSAVAARPAVRAELVARQRAWLREHGGGVVEGRDIGTVVIPDATVKIYLTADETERARRRASAPVVEGGGAPLPETLLVQSRRDLLDSGRAVSPLQVAEDAIVIDSTASTVEDVTRVVLDLVARARRAEAEMANELPPLRPPRRVELVFYRLCRIIAVGLSKALFPGPVEGSNRLPASGAYVVAPLHRSNIDWLITARISKRRLRYIAKAEVWKVPGVGALAGALGAFPVHRGSADREALARCLEVLSLGEPLVLFPEGTRRSGEAVGEILSGAAYLALRAGVPIVPIGLAGTERAMPRGAHLPRPARVAVVVGSPLHTDGVATDGRRATHVPRAASTELTDALRAGIEQASEEARTLLSSRGTGA